MLMALHLLFHLAASAVVALDMPHVSPLPTRTCARRVLLHNMYDQEVPYAKALECQRRLVAERAAMHGRQGDSAAPALEDVLICLQHPPVLTLGTSSTLDNLRSSTPPFDLFRTERGGEVTYHGPGQIVLYPLLDLRGYKQDVHWYFRTLEEVVIRTLKSLGLPAGRLRSLAASRSHARDASVRGTEKATRNARSRMMTLAPDKRMYCGCDMVRV